MQINDLIARLQEIADEHGNVEVWTESWRPVGGVEARTAQVLTMTGACVAIINP